MSVSNRVREPRPDRWPHGWPITLEITLESLVLLSKESYGNAYSNIR